MHFYMHYKYTFFVWRIEILLKKKNKKGIQTIVECVFYLEKGLVVNTFRILDKRTSRRNRS